MNEIITINEVQNDGKSIHLYYNGLVGLYTAYGFSAFNLSKVTKLNPAYSESMQMPVVVLNSEHMDEVSEKLNVVKHENGHYLLTVDTPLDEEEYDKWASKLSMGGGINL